MDENKKTKAQLINDLLQLRLEYRHYRKNNPDAAMWQQVIAHSPISIQVLDKDGYSVSVNKAHTQFFEAVPPPSYNLFTDDILLKQGLADWLSKLRQGEAVFFPDTRYNPKDYNPDFPDKTVWLKTCGFPLLNKHGKPESYVVMHEDITESIRLKKVLAEKNELVEAQKQWIADELEKEKNKFANTVHNFFGHRLTTCKYKLETLQEDENDDVKYDTIQVIIDMADEMIICCKDLTAEWRRYTEIISDFLGDMNRLADEFVRNNNIQVIFERDENLKLSSKRALLLHHILEEALSNISRHAHAKNVMICLKKKGNKCLFSIIDNGKGITSRQLHSTKAYGLMYMRECTDTLGGNFSIGKHENSGTEIYIDFPIINMKK